MKTTQKAIHKPTTKHSCRTHSLLFQSNNWGIAEGQLTIIIANHIPRPTFILMHNWERIYMYLRFIRLPVRVITAIESYSYRCLALQNHFKINTVWHIMSFLPTRRLRFLHIQFDKDFGSDLYLILILQKIGCYVSKPERSNKELFMSLEQTCFCITNHRDIRTPS